MDKEEYEQKILLNQDKLMMLARRITTNAQDAEDLAQDTIYLALRNRDRYREQDKFDAWLMALATNIRKNDLRRGRKVTTEARMREQATTQQHDETVAYLKRLPEELRETFCMLIHGYKYREIAYKMAVPIGTIKSRIHAAREKMLKLFCA